MDYNNNTSNNLSIIENEAFVEKQTDDVALAKSSEQNNPIPETNEITNWDDFDIKTDLLRGIYAVGFEKPSPIQRLAIKPMINKKDIIGQAQSGTGKTGAFSIGTLQLPHSDHRRHSN